MSRSTRWWSACLLTAALAAAVGAVGPLGAAAETSPPTLVTCVSSHGPAWAYEGETGDEWRFIASPNVPCLEQRRFIGLLAPRILSTGSVDVVRFTTADGWSCLTGRTLALGYCNSRAGGESKIVFVVPTSRSGRVLKDALVGGGATAVLGPLIGNGTATGGRGTDDEPRALGPTPCTARAGSFWNRTLAEGNMWVAYAGGGITCLAAQGWIVDVSARMSSTTRPVEFDGGDGWRCIVGPNATRQGSRVGACARTTNWRTSLEPRFAVIAGGVPGAVRTRLASRGYDAAVWEIAGAAPASFALPRTCTAKGMAWRVGSSSGNRWLVGASGGYPCAVAASAAAKLLARTQNATADATNLKGVRDAWSCRFTAATRTTRCTWNGGDAPRGRRALRLAFTPDRTGGQAIVSAALAS